ncbi:hypothetical protein [Halomontanus rarus]|nr:hypothetical protein [Halovivax sp. TS33]
MIAAALCWFSTDFEDIESELASGAWKITQELCELHGLEPSDVNLQLE